MRDVYGARVIGEDMTSRPPVRHPPLHDPALYDQQRRQNFLRALYPEVREERINT